MHPRAVGIALIVIMFCVTTAGCTTTDGSSGGWVVVGQPQQAPPPPPPPQPKKQGPYNGKKRRGIMEKAAENHLRSAYRFLQKGKPHHALKELEKAGRKRVDNFWYHYYSGGAYYYKGMYREARDSWQAAFRSTRNDNLRSRCRTCQSFAVYELRERDVTMDFLERALALNEDNETARELLREVRGNRAKPVQNYPEVEVGFIRPSDGDAGKGKGSEGKKGRKLDDDDRDDGGRYDDKDDRYRNDRKGKKPKKTRKEKKNKFRDVDYFSGYFLIEMYR